MAEDKGIISAVAGFGNYLEDTEYYDTIPFPASEIPDAADFGIRISGTARSPTYPTGQ